MTSANGREPLIAALQADLIGPFSGERDSREVLVLPPSRWYLTGFLSPMGDREPQDQDPTGEEELAAGSDEDKEESADQAPEAKQRKQFPASMGMSIFLPAKGADSITVRVSYADYVRANVENEQGQKRKPVWQRVPNLDKVATVPLNAEVLKNGVPVPDAPGIRLFGKLEEVIEAERQGLGKGTRGLSLFLVNGRSGQDPPCRDQDFIFQVEMEVEYLDGIAARPNRRGEQSTDWDERVADLQFRHRCEFAVGHGVSVDVPEGQARVTRVKTTWLPTYEVARVETRSVADVETRMETLAALADPDAVRAALSSLPEAYGRWIREQAGIEVDSKSRTATRDALMEKAERARKRITQGIEVLASDPQALMAFRFTNRAMAMQAKQRGRTAERGPEWRLFQLAFVLMNVPATVDTSHADRDIVELIFFPTGGGKTEAYLGLIAFTLLLRRLRGRERPDQGLGVAVILRYTLRLLTLDQLDRAATLMCAMDLMRKEQPELLGSVRFAVGLWVGRSATANFMKEVYPKILDFKNNRGGSPFPLADCPWCGQKLTGEGMTVRPNTQNPEEIVVACTNFRECAFAEAKNPDGLPVVFVDEQLYNELPGFVVATVDKFALMPWRGEAGKLFGRVSARDGRRFFGPMDARIPKDASRLADGLIPPELIVQDELHLISGPLGTMVGLYETAIEALCTQEKQEKQGKAIKPKIVASTATIRRSEYQIDSLYGRNREIFPPPGVNENETFFSEVTSTDKEPGRLYVGLAAPGRSLKGILLRAYVDLLCAAKKLYDQDPDGADHLMSLTGYFNSLRELGGMRRLVEDDVRSLAGRRSERTPYGWDLDNPWFKDRTIREPLELTSRETTEKITRAKAKLDRKFAEEGGIDVLLASNMISVGIDIDRLGMMVVAGQPKTTSEYIQSSSRVGRPKDRPGIVLTCFNVAKPRDRSHYERFAAYHASFYRNVEAQSLTPFCEPALDRGLVGTLMSMARLMFPEMTPPEAAMTIVENRKKVDEAVRRLASRAARIRDADGVSRLVEARAKSVLDSWETIVRSAKDGAAQRTYSPYDGTKGGKPILQTALDKDPDADSDARKFVVPTSMRDVEPGVHLWLKRGHLGASD